MQNVICFLGRLAFSVIFIVAGVNKILNWDASEQQLVNQMLDFLSKSHNYDWVQTVFDRVLPLASTLLVAATIVELGGGILILLGIHVRFAALIICLFLIPTTLLFHNFWDLDGTAKQLQMIMFLKNLSIFGGGLILLAFGTGQKKINNLSK